MYAAHKGHIIVVDALIKSGAKLDIEDIDLRTAERIAMEMHFEKIVTAIQEAREVPVDISKL